MENRPALFRSVIPVALIAVIGCAGLGKSPIRYFGDTTEVADLETPSGFRISPNEACDIIRARDGVKIFTDYYFADENNYYVLNGFRLDKSRWNAKKYGTMINGQTGEIYNRTTESWEPDPRKNAATQLATGH